MSDNTIERNDEFVDPLNTYKSEYLDCFVNELEEELADIERTLETESAKMLLNWVRDKIYTLKEDFHGDL